MATDGGLGRVSGEEDKGDEEERPQLGVGERTQARRAHSHSHSHVTVAAQHPVTPFCDAALGARLDPVTG